MRRIKRGLGRILGRWAERLLAPGPDQHDAHVSAVQAANAAHDMATDPDEAFYLKQYLHWILPELERQPPSRKACILDLGCGHGRIALDLAAWSGSGRILGVDFSESSISAARARARDAGLRNIDFRCCDLMEFLQNESASSWDAIICTEVLYNVPSYQDALKAFYRLLRPHGLLCASFRPRWFDLLKSVLARDFQSAAIVRDAREGRWASGPVWSCWHTGADVTRQLRAAGFQDPTLRGIGLFSGLKDDPLSSIARPSLLSIAHNASLLELELSLAAEYPEQSRYILALTRRNP